jgi:hypothetical protein
VIPRIVLGTDESSKTLDDRCDRLVICSRDRSVAWSGRHGEDERGGRSGQHEERRDDPQVSSQPSHEPDLRVAPKINLLHADDQSDGGTPRIARADHRR